MGRNGKGTGSDVRKGPMMEMEMDVDVDVDGGGILMRWGGRDGNEEE